MVLALSPQLRGDYPGTPPSAMSRSARAGRVIGQKQLRRFPAVTARKVRLVIDQARAPPAISEFGLHFNSLALAGSGAD